MTTRAKPVAAERVSAIDGLLVSDRETPLRRLSSAREASGASDEVGEFISDALDRIMSRVRESASGIAPSGCR
jgi:hypothetical protein